nr:amidohydrolase family protein [Dehalococcoidia bacterium]
MSQNTFALVNGSIVDALNPLPSKGHIVVSGDEIADVVSGEPQQAGITEKIDLDGKFIVPGLWDV